MEHLYLSFSSFGNLKISTNSSQGRYGHNKCHLSTFEEESESFQQRSSNSDTTFSKQSIEVGIRNMARVAAAVIIKRAVVIASLHSTDNVDSNGHDEVGKIPFVDPLKGKSIQEWKMKHQSPFFEVEDYYSSDFSASSPRKAALAQSEAESSPTVIMPAMMIEAVNFEEEFACMKAMLERLFRESAKKDAQIKRQKEHISKLLKKLDKGPRVSSNKGINSEDEKGFN